MKAEEFPDKYKVAVIGSGNWGSVAAKLIASNTLNYNIFHDEVRMWVFDETLPSGEKLSNVINQTNINVKYLPGIELGRNVIADPDLDTTVRDANMLVFVTPHQFVDGVCKRLAGKLRGDVEAISLIKGMEIAEEKFSEATLGYSENKEVADRWARLFATPYFAVTTIQDVEGVELCGTLKNVVAIAAGFVDGLDMGTNSKVSKVLSHVAARVIRTVYLARFVAVGGRNRKVAEAFAIHGGKRPFKELEAEMLQGQKLQGVSTAKEVYEVLESNRWFDSFPLFRTIHEICIGSLPPSAIVHYKAEVHPSSFQQKL
uniref:Glycerol-3-phosphate dehydrogenase [NAD(+)] n=1 Tax=Chenopodium quinoa TaxID=63459 RepID=A0A803MUK8_CHEQI